MSRLSIITLESSSIKLMIAKINDDGYFKIIDEIITPFSTLDIFLHNKKLSQEILSQIEETLINYKTLCKTLKAEKIITCATYIYSKIIEKDNLSELFKKILNTKLEYLSWKDESYYDYLNLSNSIYYESALVIDVAGYSTNISIVKGQNILKNVHIPFGSINISHTYDLIDKASKENLTSALEFIKKELIKLKAFKSIKYDSVYFIGDTIQCLNRIDRYRKKIPLTIAHNYTATDLDIIDVFNLVKSKSHLQRNRLEGMSSHLASTITGGAAIVHGIISYFNICKLTISSRNLNDSIMFQYIDKNYIHRDDILDYCLYGLINELNINKIHAEHIYSLSLTLFNALKELHNLDDSYKKIIKTSALLHDAGININYYNHHKHSFYLILNSYIDGLTHKELFLSASIAACHRNRNNYNFSFGEYSFFANKWDLKVINKISILLRIAESLDISMTQAVKDLSISIDKCTVTLNIKTDRNILLEQIEVKKCTRKFKEIYDRNLIINII